MTDLITATPEAPMSNAMRERMNANREERFEVHYLPTASVINKGDVIPPHLRKILSANKISANLKKYMEIQGRPALSIDLSEVAKFAREFIEYWKAKIGEKKEDQLASILVSEEGILTVEKYIAGEIIRARYATDMMMSDKSKFIVGCIEMYRTNRAQCHESIQSGFKIANKQIKDEFSRNGIRLDGRQQATIDTIININVQKAVDRMESQFLALFQKQQEELFQKLLDRESQNKLLTKNSEEIH
jgi:hypothetical protein